jgi:K+-transporting ATPase ATPase A chain
MRCRPRRTTTACICGLTANTPFYNGLLGVHAARPLRRRDPDVRVAGSLAAKKKIPAGAGTPTHTPLFVAP